MACDKFAHFVLILSVNSLNVISELLNKARYLLMEIGFTKIYSRTYFYTLALFLLGALDSLRAADIVTFTQSRIYRATEMPVSYALTPILPFDSHTWLFLFVTMHACVVVYYFVKRCSEIISKTQGCKIFSNVKRIKIVSSFRNTYLEVVAVYLQQSFTLGTSRLSVRIINAVLLISGIILENAYSGGLKSLLTIPRYLDKIETVSQFVKTGFKWGAPQPAWVLTLTHATVPDDLAMAQRFDMQPGNVLRNNSFQKDYGIAVERLHAGSYSFGNYVQIDALEKQDMLKEDLYFEYTNGYAIRGWPLMGYFDKIILEVIQHGIFHHWESESVNRYLNLTTENYLRQMASGYSENSGPAVLLIAHIYGPLSMLGIGVVAATVAFIGEHIYYHSQRGSQRARKQKKHSDK